MCKPLGGLREPLAQLSRLHRLAFGAEPEDKWTKAGPNAARWEQAFSYDGGKTWETNWTNELTRVR